MMGRENRKIEIIIFAFFVLALCSCPRAAGTSSVQSSATSIGSFYISSQSLYSPYPVEPGKYMDLWLRVQYRGEKIKAENVMCMVEAKFPFSFDPGESPVREIGTMAPFDEVVLKYRLRVNESAVQGYNSLIFKCKSSTSEWIGAELSYYVQTHEAILSVEKVESIPAKFRPGDEGKVNIYIKNLADSTIKDISVKLDLSSEDIPFAPINSTIEKRMQDLAAKVSAVIVFDIMTLNEADAGTYKIPIVLQYSDILGNVYTKNSIISITVQADLPNVLLVHEQTNYILNEARNSVTISVVNIGDTQIKYVTAELGSDEGYILLSPREMYVGSINSDDSETLEFDLFINSSLPQIYLPLTLTFSDVEGNSYKIYRTVEIKVYSKEAALQLGIENAVTTDPLVIVIISIIVLYIFYQVVKFLFFRKKRI
ncbi:MAG: hypothetical protein QW112_01305 [Candidatus Micrarchaeia archaeon]